MRRTDALLHAFAASVAVVVVAWPLASVTYPPITDLPFHAAHTSAFRHWFDDAYHFRDQFELRPLSVPYLSSYVLGALLMVPLSTTAAVKTATAILLLLVPAGLATLAWGMRRTPLLGLVGLPLVWGHLTQWGFVNFVGALGLFTMALGLALRAVDLPSRGVQVALATVLVVLFFTHVFRYPFAVAGVLAAAAVTWPVHRRLAPALWPLAPSLVLFAVWWFVRPAGLTAGPIELSWEPARWKLLPAYVVQGFRDPRQLQIAERHLWIVAAVAALSLVLAFLRRHESTRESRRRALLAALVPVGGALALLALYFSLPMAIGVWWYAYPREATAFAVLALAAVPDLPRERWLRAVIVAALSGSALSASALVAHHYAAFERSGREFEAVARRVPQAPKLLYLVFDHSGSARTISPYVHLPAWIQAERGGWLGFHFSAMNASPLVYREDAGAVVPPRLPAGWEWMPNRFRLEEHGAFFDWFLVRSEGDPKALFSADPTIRPVAHEGRWWLFARGARQSAVTS